MTRTRIHTYLCVVCMQLVRTRVGRFVRLMDVPSAGCNFLGCTGHQFIIFVRSEWFCFFFHFTSSRQRTRAVSCTRYVPFSTAGNKSTRKKVPAKMYAIKIFRDKTHPEKSTRTIAWTLRAFMSIKMAKSENTPVKKIEIKKKRCKNAMSTENTEWTDS